MATDYEALLETLGVEMRPVSSSGWMVTLCPIHEDSHPSFAVNLNTGGWACYAGCGSGKLPSLVMQLKSVSNAQAREFIASYEGTGLVTVTTDELASLLTPQSATRQVALRRPAGLTTERWPLWFIERGFDADAWRLWEMALDERTGDVCLPVYDRHGIYHGEIRRRQPGVIPKYLYDTTIPRSDILFGERMYALHPSDRVWLVEGSLDAIWLWRRGARALATLGTFVSRQQRKRLLELGTIKQVTLAFDNDDAGRRAQEQNYGILKDLFKLDVMDIPEQFKDVQDIRDERLLDSLLV
jgi:DNA primase